ncbi:MAG: CBS domain-containing protein [Cyanobacteria bacterium P01_E01_bin.48]
MSFTRNFPGAVAIAEAIDCHPLTLAPETVLADAIALMSRTSTREGLLCSLDEQVVPQRSSCALVTEGRRLLGILTERDIVRLTAAEIDFSSVRMADVMTSPVISMPQTSLQDVFAALFFFRRYRIRHLPIVDDSDNLVGLITPSHIRRVLRPASLLKMLRVADVMSAETIQAPPDVPVLKLAQIMATERVSCIVIVDNDPERGSVPVGIVTERDITQYQLLQLNVADLPAADVMSAPLFLLSPDDSLWDAHQRMEEKHVRRLVVSWNWGKGIGLVTQTSLMRAFDPVEMYGVIESLQDTVRGLHPETVGRTKTRELLSHSQALHVAERPTSSSNEMTALLLALETSLHHLADRPELPASDRYRQLRAALADLARMRELLDLPEQSRQVG